MSELPELIRLPILTNRKCSKCGGTLQLDYDDMGNLIAECVNCAKEYKIKKEK